MIKLEEIEKNPFIIELCFDKINPDDSESEKKRKKGPSAYKVWFSNSEKEFCGKGARDRVLEFAQNLNETGAKICRGFRKIQLRYNPDISHEQREAANCESIDLIADIDELVAGRLNESATISYLQEQGFKPRGNSYYNGSPLLMVKYDGGHAVAVYIQHYRDHYRLSRAETNLCLEEHKPQ